MLISDSALESRIITSFLEAADYEVTDLSILSLTSPSRLTLPFDAAVLVASPGDSDVGAKCSLIRDRTRLEHLPIVAVMTQAPVRDVEAVYVLVRPIRLFDLVHAVDQVVARSGSGSRDRSRTLHNLHA